MGEPSSRLLGQSAGAMSVGLHYVSEPMYTSGLFRRAITESNYPGSNIHDLDQVGFSGGLYYPARVIFTCVFVFVLRLHQNSKRAGLFNLDASTLALQQNNETRPFWYLHVIAHAVYRSCDRRPASSETRTAGTSDASTPPQGPL